MPAESILVRTYTDHDLEAYRHLYTFAASEREEALKMSPHFINTILARPSYSPQQDLFVLEKEEQELIGFIDIFSEIEIDLLGSKFLEEKNVSKLEDLVVMEKRSYYNSLHLKYIYF